MYPVPGPAAKKCPSLKSQHENGNLGPSEVTLALKQPGLQYSFPRANKTHQHFNSSIIELPWALKSKSLLYCVQGYKRGLRPNHLGLRCHFPVRRLFQMGNEDVFLPHTVKTGRTLHKSTLLHLITLVVGSILTVDQS